MQEYEIPTKEGMLRVKKYKKGVEIAGYLGEDIRLSLPDAVTLPESGDCGIRKEGLPVVSIGKKALLSCKNLRSIYLPASLEEIDDWAFAYCDELREIYAPRKHIRFGRGIFRECGKLRAVYVEGGHRDTGGLLAAVATLLDAPYLFDLQQAGEEEWLERWDARMLELLGRDDHEGYSRMVLCGEEDYGSRENNLDYFLNQKRRSKVRISYMRLLNPLKLSGETKEKLERYLREHTAGCLPSVTEKDKNVGQEMDESWQVLLEEHGEDSDYYRLFAKTGCLTEKNFDRILGGIKDRYPEMKAYFMKYKEESIGYSDFFGDILADF